MPFNEDDNRSWGQKYQQIKEEEDEEEEENLLLCDISFGI